jgi:glucokinase
MPSYRIGLDLGGTKLLGIVTDPDHTVVKRRKQALANITAVTDMIDVIAELFEELSNGLDSREIDAVGLALPSPVDPERGLAKSLTAFGWKNVPVGELLMERLGRRVKLGNDVNLATLAEFRLGAGRGARSLYTFYPGTGLGGGYIHNGKLVLGTNHTAAEVGHMVVQIDGPRCNCGQTGCLEAIVSNAGFRRMVAQAVEEGRTTVLSSTDRYTSETIVSAWEAGDEVVREILSFQAKTLGIGIANVINITGVERIIIGGDVYRRLWDDLYPMVRSRAEAHAIGGGMEGVVICLNALGAEAPALGATLL